MYQIRDLDIKQKCTYNEREQLFVVTGVLVRDARRDSVMVW